MPGCDVGTVSCTPYFSEICSLTTPVTAYVVTVCPTVPKTRQLPHSQGTIATRTKGNTTWIYKRVNSVVFTGR